MGIRKGGCPWPKGIHNLVTEKKDTLKISRFLACCVITHNMMLDIEMRPDHLLEECIEDYEDIPDIHESSRNALNKLNSTYMM